MNCTRRHTLVTGSSSGIGRATALCLAAAGQHVYAGVRHAEDGEQLARSAAGGNPLRPPAAGGNPLRPPAAGGEITPLILDVTDPAQIEAAAAAIGAHGGLDGLVNNAGYGLACPTELVPLDAFRRQLEVNVTGQLAVTQAMLPALRQARGRIVMVSTIGVRFTPPFAGPLDAAKAALAALGDTLRQCAGSGVTPRKTPSTAADRDAMRGSQARPTANWGTVLRYSHQLRGRQRPSASASSSRRSGLLR